MKNSNISSLKDYLAKISKKIYLSPDESVISDCCSYIQNIEEDLDTLKNINTSSEDIFYLVNSIMLSSESEKDNNFQENSKNLESLTKSYVFTNIQKKGEE